MHPLLLDLDGTLVDSRRDLAAAVNALLGDLGLEPLSTEIVVGFVGNGARTLVVRALAAADPEGRAPRDEPTLRSFLGHYQRVMLDHTAPYPGVMDGLARLRAAGVPHAIVTNKPEAPARVIVGALGIDADVLLGGDTLPTRKPDPAMLEEAARRLDVPLETCLMVGDSDVDVESALRAGVPAVWCSWGGIHRDSPCQPCRRADRFEQVVELALGL